jgi:hypothetical protein
MLFQLIRDQRLLNEKAVFAEEQAGNRFWPAIGKRFAVHLWGIHTAASQLPHLLHDSSRISPCLRPKL